MGGLYLWVGFFWRPALPQWCCIWGHPEAAWLLLLRSRNSAGPGLKQRDTEWDRIRHRMTQNDTVRRVRHRMTQWEEWDTEWDIEWNNKKQIDEPIISFKPVVSINMPLK